MARYIDADALTEQMLNHYKALRAEYGDYDHYTTGYDDAIDTIGVFPTADVAPKSEVAREIIDEAIRAVYSKTDMKIYNTIEGKPLGDGVAFGKQQAMYDVITLLAELKKKYTERKEDEGK